ncbi:MAG: hypothetical protein CSA95_08790 [Bacteroidetes bacterium]|nr:MAG: hypothetical protein CSA95_08790 [Bacteroidota bacterium]
MFEGFSLSFGSALTALLVFVTTVLVMWGLQLLKKERIAISVFSEKGAFYMVRLLQIIVFLWGLFFTVFFLELPFLDVVKQPLVAFDNFRVTPYVVFIVVTEFLLILLVRQGFSTFFRRWLAKKELKTSRMNTILMSIDIFIWLGGLFLILSTMNVPIRTLFTFPLFSFGKGNKVITVGSVVVLILVFSLTSWVLSLLEDVFMNVGAVDKESRPRRKAIFSIFKYFIWVLIVVLSLETIGVKLSVLIASSAAIFVGLGLGIQDIFKDLISGVFLNFEKNLREGDVIESEGIVGEVKEMGLRTTKIRTRDDIFMMVPNHQFITQPVINWSHFNQNTRFNVEVGVAYGSDVSKVEKLLLDCAIQNKRISSSPKPFVRFHNFGNSSLDFQLFFWTEETFKVENIKSEVRFSICQAFSEHGIQIPFPQQDVYIKEMRSGLPQED